MSFRYTSPDSKVHWAYMGPTWGRQDPGGSHVGPMILALWVLIFSDFISSKRRRYVDGDRQVSNNISFHYIVE